MTDGSVRRSRSSRTSTNGCVRVASAELRRESFAGAGWLPSATRWTRARRARSARSDRARPTCPRNTTGSPSASSTETHANGRRSRSAPPRAASSCRPCGCRDRHHGGRVGVAQTFDEVLRRPRDGRGSEESGLGDVERGRRRRWLRSPLVRVLSDRPHPGGDSLAFRPPRVPRERNAGGRGTRSRPPEQDASGRRTSGESSLSDDDGPIPGPGWGVRCCPHRMRGRMVAGTTTSVGPGPAQGHGTGPGRGQRRVHSTIHDARAGAGRSASIRSTHRCASVLLTPPSVELGGGGRSSATAPERGGRHRRQAPPDRAGSTAQDLRAMETFNVEVDAMPGGFVCSASFKSGGQHSHPGGGRGDLPDPQALPEAAARLLRRTRTGSSSTRCRPSARSRSSR